MLSRATHKISKFCQNVETQLTLSRADNRSDPERLYFTRATHLDLPSPDAATCFHSVVVLCYYRIMFLTYDIKFRMS